MAVRLNKAKEIAKMMKRIKRAQKQGYIIEMPDVKNMTARQIKGFARERLRKQAIDTETGEIYKVTNKDEFKRRTQGIQEMVAPDGMYEQLVRDFLRALQPQNVHRDGSKRIADALDRWVTEYGVKNVAETIEETQEMGIEVGIPILYDAKQAAEYLSQFISILLQNDVIDNEAADLWENYIAMDEDMENWYE